MLVLSILKVSIKEDTPRKETFRLVDYEGEQYLTATEIARRFSISRGTCYNNILPHVQGYYLPGRKNTLYRLSDVEQFSHVHVVARNTVTSLTMVI